MDAILTSLTDAGILPWAAALLVVAIASFVLSKSSRRRTVAVSRLRELEALREGRQPNARYSVASMSRVVDDTEDDSRFGAFGPLLLNISGLISRLPLLGAKDREKLTDQLYRAGIRHDDALGLYVAAKGFCLFLGGIVVFLTVTWLGLFETKQILRIVAALAAGLAGSLLPDFVLDRITKSRQSNIIRNLPDALDLMVICTEAGLSLDPTVERVARELRLSAPELARELAVMSHEMRILPKREMALENFGKRNDYREVKSLISTLIQTLRYGTSLAHSLRVLAQESRNARMLAVEEKAARLPAMMSIPLICFMLPAIFLVIAGPAVSRLMQLF